MKTRFVIIVVKVITFGLKLIHRGGSLPGQIGLAIDKQVLTKLKYPKHVIVVSGTNGKTTTNNMIYQVMKEKYNHVICNVRGDNLLVGIATLLLNNTAMDLQVKADCIVLEVDELNVPYVLANVQVSDVVMLNFFRDQLDRAGEMETLIQRVETGLATYQGRLLLNGDDPNVVRLSDKAKGEVYYYGVDKNDNSDVNTNEASEGKFCFRCHAPLTYIYYQYSHIGRFHCEKCGFGNLNYYVQAQDIAVDTYQFKVQDYVFQAPQQALYSLYNSMAVIGVATLYEIPYERVAAVLQTFDLKDGRMEAFNIGSPCLLNLVKNPTGANEVMKFIMRDSKDKEIVVVLNDNIQDGTDVSWIWDAHFERLVDTSTKRIVCSGLRAYDMALRFKYEGYDNIEVIEDVGEALQAVKGVNRQVYVIATYTALQTTRALLRRMSI